MYATKIKKYLSVKKCLAMAALAMLIVASLQHPLLAQSLAQSYGSDTPLQRGMIVGLKQDEPDKVKPLNFESPEHVHGVVIDANDTPVTLTQEGQTIFLASVGRHEVLVSTQNGNIVSGDLISVSALAGIGTKADERVEFVMGKALANYDGSANEISKSTLQEAGGTTREISIGRIPVDISITRNPLIKPKEPDLPGFLKKISEGIAHKPVSSIRLYTSFAVLLATTILSLSLIYGSVRSSVYSLGRNPLSKKVIFRGMFQVIIVGIIIFITGIFGVYLLLRL